MFEALFFLLQRLTGENYQAIRFYSDESYVYEKFPKILKDSLKVFCWH